MRHFASAAATACCLLLVCDAALATTQRTFVASTGNDANPCSITLPCRGFAAAMANTSTGGEIIVQDSAGYGAVVIDKSVKIIAPAGVYAGITAGPGVTGVTVNGSNIDVALIGLSINGLPGFAGIAFQQGASLLIERCTISDFAGDGIRLLATGSRTTIRDTVIRHNGANAIVTADLPTQSQSLHVARVHVEGSFWGIVLGHGTIAQIDDSVVVDNSNTGVWVHVTSAGPSATQLTMTRSRVAQNYYGVMLDITATGGGGTVDGWISDCDISEQSTYGVQLYAVDNAFNFVRATLANNRIVGNGDYGVFVEKAGAGWASAVLTGNVIARNGNYGVMNFNGVVRTLQNNAVDSNTPSETSGTLTNFLGK